MAPFFSIPEMSLLRSEDMNLVQLIIPVESAHGTISYLGELGLLQFEDLNLDKSPFQRTYANQVKRCIEMVRKLRYLWEQLRKAGLSAARSPPEIDIDLDELEIKLGELEAELRELDGNLEKLKRTHSELTEYLLVLSKASTFFEAARNGATSYQRESSVSSMTREGSMDSPLLLEQTDPSKQIKLGFIAGLIAKTKAASFERILFRATRGNLFYKQLPLDEPVTDPATGVKVEKLVFVCFYSGERARTKITKICEAFGANRYSFPEEHGKRWQLKTEVASRVTEIQSTIDASILERDTVLSAVSYQLEQWTTLVQKEKAIYHTLNMLSFDVTKKCLVGEAWCPVAAKVKVQDALRRAASDSNSQVSTIFQVLHSEELPPTYFKVNKFTEAFQQIVDAYGVPRYKEINPGVFTIVTFPFLFAVMFGDWGHGICILLATLWLVYNEKKFGTQKLGDIMDMTFGGRYVLLLMAIFSIYTGFIYNEFFSVPFHLFGDSAYRCRTPSCSDATTVGLIKYREEPYPFGVDPVWHGSRSELPFLNSLKMKMSIILGVIQMMLGIILSYFNATFFRSSLDVWFQFVPQILFLGSLFGYLSVLIILKWVTGSQADLYHVMIYMFLSPTSDIGDNRLFKGQERVQIILLLISFVAVPWMLLPKPLILRKQHLEKLQGRGYGVLRSSDADALDIDLDHEHEHEEFEFSEAFVHQMIHTIEFVLGAVSNTASYLRLWALSLAHAELSAVFYERVLLLSWSYHNPIILLVGFIVFLFATIGVLLVMETLSAFLHALRLHWVEFQNKFYQGDGYQFSPFAFSSLEDID
ncbi:hypothetical protein O6H91_13G012300 [Diphasiastrum complanatum]|uniref:Uncharacterized protein n=1 Tax=Diphasiastrum complanatum TaxID=34168 RepID=A0ACC2BSY9_DIPCM|nr:hypothetical protein O6H91_13G012300 [Diphasiastrum complanatum]